MTFLKWSLIVTVVLSTSNVALACQLPQSYYKNVSCTSNSHYFLAVKDSGLPVALLNSNGNSVADLTPYTQVDTGKLFNGVMPVQRSGKVGYIDTQGREVVPIIYDMLADDTQTSGWARAANSNRIVVRKNGRFGVISTSNQVILPFSNQYRSISDFKNGVAEIQKNNGVSWIATNGRAVQNPNAPSPSAVTRTDQSSVNTNPSTLNNPLSIPQSALFQNEIWQPAQRDGKWGFINSQNVPMIRFSFDEVTPFSEGLAGVRVNNNWGFIDLSGALVIPFRFDEYGVIRDETTLSASSTPPFVFHQGKAWIGNLNDGTKLCIDTDGTNVPCDGSSPQPPVTLTETSTEKSTSSKTLVVSTVQTALTQNSPAQHFSTEISADESSTTFVSTVLIPPVKQVEPLHEAEPVEKSVESIEPVTTIITSQALNVESIRPDQLTDKGQSGRNIEAISIKPIENSNIDLASIPAESPMNNDPTRTTTEVKFIKPTKVVKAADTSDASHPEIDIISLSDDDTTSNSTTESEPLIDSKPVDIMQPVQQAPKPLNVIDTPAIYVTVSTDTVNKEASELYSETKSELHIDTAKINTLANELSNELEVDESISLTHSENANVQNEQANEQNNQNEFSNSITTRIVSIKPVQSAEVDILDVSERNLDEESLNEESLVIEDSLTINETQSVIRTQNPN